jgi:translation initiation factor 2 subunit 2
LQVTIAGDVADEANAKQDAPHAVAAAADPADLADVSAMFGTKKKKKQLTKKADEDEADGAAAGENVPVVSDLIDYPDWPDYSYDEVRTGVRVYIAYLQLLTRVFTIMHEKNPSLSTGESKRIQMKPPNVTRAGTKKTAFINFAEICRL